MPTIDTTLADLHHLVGKPLSIKELDELLAFAKGEIESHDPATGIIRIKLEDTNQPYLWCAEGIALLLRGVLGIDKGMPNVSVKPSKDEVIIDSSVKSIRPFIAVFSAHGPEFIDEFLRQLIQFQEKFCDAFGMKRSKVSIGIYPYEKIAFPITYKAVAPSSTRFVPLGFTKELSLSQILTEHPTGKEFSFTLAKQPRYPILIDNKGKVLSLIPIINSNDLGKLEIGDTNLMFECTGTDQLAVDLCANIFAHILWIRGYTISSCTINDGKQSACSPQLSPKRMKIDVSLVNTTLGTAFTSADIKKYLEKCRHNVSLESVNTINVTIPSFRSDVMHPIDLVEDVAIMADYNSLPTHPLTSYTVGDVKPIEHTIDIVRNVMAGFGLQEVLSPLLSNKDLINSRMHTNDLGTIEITEFMSKSYSCLRSWIIPILMDVLSKNLHREYPQNIFETGEICRLNKGQAEDKEHCGVALCSAEADYTRIRQVLDALLSVMGCSPATYEPLNEKEPTFGAFIPGRAALCRFKGTPVAILGEIHPIVLDEFSIRTPVSVMEIDISAIHELR